MEQTEMTMGRRIAQRRKTLKMTQERLAQEMGVSAQAVSKWENDLSCPDISILPKLAKTLGMTTDELLGSAPEKTVHEAEVVDDPSDGPGIHVEHSDGKSFDIHFDTPRRASLVGALWLICLGGLMLAGQFGLDRVGFWTAAWISGLFAWGVSGMSRRVRFSNVVATLGGLYFALTELGILKWNLGWEIVFPALVVLLGVSLLIDGLRRKNGRRSVRFTAPADRGSSRIAVEDGVLSYSDSFGEDHYVVNAPVLKAGQINVSFGEHELDFSGVESVAEGCAIELNASFGEVWLRIPSRFRVNLSSSKSFAECHIMGEPDASCEGVINLVSSISFGELTITYI